MTLRDYDHRDQFARFEQDLEEEIVQGAAYPPGVQGIIYDREEVDIRILGSCPARMGAIEDHSLEAGTVPSLEEFLDSSDYGVDALIHRGSPVPLIDPPVLRDAWPLQVVPPPS